MYAYLAVLLALCAGIINGSYSVPSKHIKQWSFENTWLSYALWAFLILPLITTLIFKTNVFHLYGLMPNKLLWIMVIGGLLFGLGQIGLAIAIDTIGIGLTFTIAIGLSTGLGFLLPLLFEHANAILTPFGLLTLIGVLLSLLGLILSTLAGNHRRQPKGEMKEIVKKVTPHAKSTFIAGILLAMFAGLFSAGQNLTFSLTRPMQMFALAAHVNPLWAANIVWPGFLLATLVPYVLYMLYRQVKYKTYALYKKPISFYYIILTLVMGAFWFFSLLVYGKSARMIGPLGPIIGWPVFMIFIILTSNFWGWVHGEWKNCGKTAIRLLRLSLIFLVLAFIFLGISVEFQVPSRSLTSHQPIYKSQLASIVKSTQQKV